jgi:aromatic-L-amino-acid decarboxylase
MDRNWKLDTLDPENWDEMRALGHRMLDDMMTYLENIDKQSMSPPTDEAVKEICTKLSMEGEGEESVYNLYKQHILPHTFANNTYPRFWGFVSGTGSPYGMLTEMVRAGMNGGVDAFLAGLLVHQQTIDWIKELLDYPSEAGGVIVSGGSEANFTGLAVARNAKAEVDMKAKGVQSLNKKMTLYCSEETHHCTERSVELLGLGNEALRWVPVGDEYKVNLDALKKTIKDDRKNGYHPFCIIGNAGTVNGGAFDDFNALADLAKRENMWLHVDGAFGAWIKLSKTHRHLADGLERADSIALDLYKWMDMPYGIGCILVKDRLAHFSTFVYGHEAKYLKTAVDTSKDQWSNPSNLALPNSRNFATLSAYMLLKAYGKEKYCRLVQQNIDQINYLASLIEKEPKMEITSPVISNIVCFRYNPGGLGEKELEELNRKILGSLWGISFALITDTTMRGKYSLRACNVNHRSRYTDFDWLVSEVKRIGGELDG